MNINMGFKSAVEDMINHHFPSDLSKRFTIRSTTQIWQPNADETVWNMKKNDAESMHVLFDGVEIIEVPFDSRYEAIELWFLRKFRDAIKDGTISIGHKKEHMSTDDVKRRKREIEKEKKDKLVEAIKASNANPMSKTEMHNIMEENKKKAARAKADKKAGDKLKER